MLFVYINTIVTRHRHSSRIFSMLTCVSQFQWFFEFYDCKAVKRLLLVKQTALNIFDLKVTDIFTISKQRQATRSPPLSS